MWSIAIYSGDSPFDLKPVHAHPVLTKAHVSDMRAKFVADPFMLQRHRRWYMFMEIMNKDTNRGEIGLATSNDGLDWTYQQIVLNEQFHLSYPYVFEWQNDYYMLPEALGSGAVCLYKADDFPFGWSCVARLLEGRFADPSIFRFNDRWWMFTCSTPYKHDTLRLYSATELTGPWTEHPKSPVVEGDKSRARPAGRILSFNNQLLRFAQDCGSQYGTSVRAFEILQLTMNSYTEVEYHKNPILKGSSNGWNKSGMHHIDARRRLDGKWLACVDGY
jgi:hypothetical protein